MISRFDVLPDARKPTEGTSSASKFVLFLLTKDKEWSLKVYFEFVVELLSDLIHFGTAEENNLNDQVTEKIVDVL